MIVNKLEKALQRDIERKKKQKAMDIVRRDLRKAKGDYLAKEVTEESLREDFPGVDF